MTPGEFENPRFIEAAEVIATSGRWDAINERVKVMAANPGAPEDHWRFELFAGLSSHVFSEYLALKKAYNEGAVRTSLVAWRARSLLELSVWSMYGAASRENARRIYEDAGRDVHGIFAAFEKWGEATTQVTGWFEWGTTAQERLSEQALSRGIASLKEPFKEVRHAARDIGIGAHFQLCYRILSKFAHPTAMTIVMLPPAIQSEAAVRHCEVFFNWGCLFFTGAVAALEKGVPPGA